MPLSGEWCSDHRCTPIAISRVETWLLDPTAENLDACDRLIGADTLPPSSIPQFAWCLLAAVCGIRVPADTVLQAARLTSEQAVRAAIRAEVVPWVLGERDPVATRAQHPEG
jgi:hypothetical protein